MEKQKNKIKKFLFVYLLFFIILTTVSFVYAILLHNNILSTKTSSFNRITFIIGIILFFILGFLIGKVAKQNGLLEGLIAALIIILLSLLINLIVKIDLNSLFFIKAGSYILSSMAGGIIGVNTLKKK